MRRNLDLIKFLAFLPQCVSVYLFLPCSFYKRETLEYKVLYFYSLYELLALQSLSGRAKFYDRFSTKYISLKNLTAS